MGNGRRLGKESWSIRVVLRYLLFQIPGWILTTMIVLLADYWLDLASWTAAALILLWIAKDIVLFPFVWRAYDQSPSRVVYGMVGERAVVIERLSPAGYVRVHGERWRAEAKSEAAPVEAGRKVRIVEVRGLTLVVEPE